MKKCCNDPKILTDENNVGYCQNCHKEIPKPKLGEVDMLFVRTKDFHLINKTTVGIIKS